MEITTKIDIKCYNCKGDKKKIIDNETNINTVDIKMII